MFFLLLLLHFQASLCSTDSCRSESGDRIPGYLYTTPNSQRTLKRRRLRDSAIGFHQKAGGSEVRRFVPASSLVPSDFVWLESPRQSQSLHAPLSQTESLFTKAPDYSVLDDAFEHANYSKPLTSACTSVQTKDRTQKPGKIRTSSKSLRCSSSVGANKEKLLHTGEDCYLYLSFVYVHTICMYHLHGHLLWFKVHCFFFITSLPAWLLISKTCSCGMIR